MLLCVKQSSVGGENEFTDGFQVAEQLRKEDPDTFRILSEIGVYYSDIGTDSYSFNLLQRQNVIGLVVHYILNVVVLRPLLCTW